MSTSKHCVSFNLTTLQAASVNELNGQLLDVVSRGTQISKIIAVVLEETPTSDA